MRITPPPRYREIATVLGRNGFEWLLSKWGISSILGTVEGHSKSKRTPEQGEPERLRIALEELGTTFIKIGQMLSTRPDLLPEAYIAELTKLQDQAPSVAYEQILATFHEEFGKPPDQVFQSFSPEPRATASIAQVHEATLTDGTKVVVKIRRPGVQVQVDEDLAILGHVARFLAHNTEWGEKFDFESLVDEFSNSLRNELDFAREGSNSERIAAEFLNDPCLHVPKIFWDYSTHAVLTMEDVNGIKIDDLEALDAAGLDRHMLAKNCAHIALVQVLNNGFFHADPHPGNFFVLPNGVIALIDYGMVGRLGAPLRQSLVRLSLAVSREDTDGIIDELFTLGSANGGIDRPALSRDIDHLLQRYQGLPLGEISATSVFRDVTITAHRHTLRLPSDLIMLIRVIAMDEGLGASLDPDFNLVSFAQPYFQTFWKKDYSFKSIRQRLKDEAIDMANLGPSLPKRFLRLVGKIERGEMEIATRVKLDSDVSKTVQHVTNRLAMSVLMAGLIVGLSFLAATDHTDGFSYLLLRALLLSSIGSGVWLFVALWRSAR